MKKCWLLCLWMIVLSPICFASDLPDEATPEPKVRYRAGKEIDFDATAVDGRNSGPQISVVTGEEMQKTDGLLRLRKNFVDRIAQDAGEEAP